VFCSTRSICLSMPRRSESLMRCTCRTGCSHPPTPGRPLERQRKQCSPPSPWLARSRQDFAEPLENFFELFIQVRYSALIFT